MFKGVLLESETSSYCLAYMLNYSVYEKRANYPNIIVEPLKVYCCKITNSCTPWLEKIVNIGIDDLKVSHVVLMRANL